MSALSRGLQQLQNLQSRSTRDARERSERNNTRSSVSLQSILGLRDRRGKHSDAIEQHAQEEHEKRLKFEEEVETGVFMTTLEAERIIIDDGTQGRAIEHMRETAKFNVVNAIASIETAGDYYMKFRANIKHNFQDDEQTGEKLIEDAKRILTRVSDYWATLAVGPQIQRSMHGMGDLER